MQFITNKISTGKGKSFEELAAQYLGKDKKVVKVAEVKEKIKVAEEKCEAPSSGQPEAEAKLVNEPEVQDQETTKGTSSSKDEAPSSGQPEAEAKLVNVPKVQATGKTKVKEAETEEDDIKKDDIKKDKIKKDEAKEAETKEVEIKKAQDEKEDSKDDDKEKEDSKDDDKEKEDNKDDDDDDDGGLTDAQKTLPEALQKAIKNKKSSDLKFVKIANLDAKSKAWLDKYYKNIWPAEFVDALLADK